MNMDMDMDMDNTTRCPLCGGGKVQGTTTVTVDLGDALIVVRDVPATLCSLCGADWINDDTAQKVEDIVEDARKKHNQIEVTSLKAS